MLRVEPKCSPSAHNAQCRTLTNSPAYLQVELPQVGLLQTAASRRVEFVFQPAVLDQLDIPHRVSDRRCCSAAALASWCHTRQLVRTTLHATIHHNADHLVPTTYTFWLCTCRCPWCHPAGPQQQARALQQLRRQQAWQQQPAVLRALAWVLSMPRWSC